MLAAGIGGVMHVAAGEGLSWWLLLCMFSFACVTVLTGTA